MSKMVSVRVDEELLEYLQDRANKECRTLSNMIISALKTEQRLHNNRRDIISRKDVLSMFEQLSDSEEVVISKGTLEYLANHIFSVV